MTDKTLAALTALANKLGTTTEFLWETLLRQALIHAAADFVFVTAFAAFTIWFGRLVFRKGYVVPPKTEDNKHPRIEWDEELVKLATVVAVFFSVIAFVFTGFMIENVVTAIFNADYWALKQILEALK